ncbi:hypothetical protein FRACYDRAFT_234857 [Fragilariopsis cylindrus CCMP1102]|uniref:Uncharacterized protein n=1 Tax=Fragilariopsis cylindrus CCMP1102 TaxID=635003 RepID=A0A1E7FSS3_9STRA|nr:hypothetical protein FRACYDRAFT_234857 [Fragilariopsis cylindrus CCMP1102]|eukprot:OEU21232.1 hypothetical protein FRACYDRAFT_234857 [Fragilariopsis cylindrus CCMP1102]
MVKRKIDRTRSKNKQKKLRKTTNNKDEKDKDLSNEFTAEEEEEPLPIHIRRSPPKKRRSNNAAYVDNDGNLDGLDSGDGDDDVNQDDENVDNNYNSIFDIAPEEIENETNFDDEDNKNQNEWHYFVHYEGWKSIWDRWVAESDIWEITEVNIERMKEISITHKALQREFKGKTKKGKIQNGGLFLKEWKEQLDGLHCQWAKHDSTTITTTSNGDGEKDDKVKKVMKRKKKSKQKKCKKSSTEILHNRSDLAIQSCLTTRQPSHIQAIPLSFGLKRILVEDWENLNSTNRAEEATQPTKTTTANLKDASSSASLEITKWDMVHALPAKITIRNALSLYLKDKGISWDGIVLIKNQATTSSSNENSKNNDEMLNRNEKISESESNQNNLSEPGQSLSIEDEQKEKISGSSMDDTCGKVVVATDESALMKNEQEETSTSNVNDTGTEVLVATKTSKHNPEETSTKDAQIDMTASLPDKTPSQEVVTKDESNNNDDNGEEEVSLQLAKEWTDMADGIVLYFEQALMSRLLYPSEISQLLVLEDGLPDGTPFLQKVDIYGCEHLLRLLASMPRILDQQFQDSRKKKMERKQNALIKDGDTTTEQEKIEGVNDEDETDADQDAFVEVGSMILAKLQDFARFLQKNQSTLFGSLYRKKNDEEIKRDLKIQKRQERRLQSAAAKATSVMLQKTDQQEECVDTNDDDDEEKPMQLE